MQKEPRGGGGNPRLAGTKWPPATFFYVGSNLGRAPLSILSNLSQKKAKKWTCAECGVTVSRASGERVALPDSWSRSKDGTFCLLCRRERAARAALDSAPANCPLEERAKLRRAALIEFEVRRRPSHGNGEIAKTCRSSVAAVAAARKRLKLPAPDKVA